jgi:catalase
MGAGSVLSTVAGPSTAPPPGSLGQETPPERKALLDKVSGRAAGRQAGMPFNAEQGRRARRRLAHAAARPDLSGAASRGHRQHRRLKPSLRRRSAAACLRLACARPVTWTACAADGGGQRLTTNQAIPVSNNQDSLKIGLRGPTLLEDFILREKITHFDHERIPERVVHARGSAAHGYFECYRDL